VNLRPGFGRRLARAIDHTGWFPRSRPFGHDSATLELYHCRSRSAARIFSGSRATTAATGRSDRFPGGRSIWGC